MDLSFWRDKKLWVIGGSTGIGRAVAVHAASLGAHVAISARSAEALTSLVALLPGAAHHALPLDATDVAQVKKAAATLLEKWGSLDCVLFCTGTYQHQKADAFDLSIACQTIDTNLKSALNVLSATVPQLISQGYGQLVMTASVAGFVGLPGGLAYGASKAGLINLTESARADLLPHGIDVRLINPGFVKTPLTDKNTFPMPCIISAEEAAHCILQDLAKPGFEIHFPKRFTMGLKLLRALPYALSLPLIRKLTA